VPNATVEIARSEPRAVADNRLGHPCAHTIKASFTVFQLPIQLKTNRRFELVLGDVKLAVTMNRFARA